MINIEVNADNIKISSPYHPELPKKARKIGGNWTGGVWQFDIRDEQRVRDLYKSVYGYDELDTETVDVRITIKKDDYLISYQQGIYIAGREIASARGRDSGMAVLGDKVVVIEGFFTGGGGAKSWGAKSTKGAVFEIRDLYRIAYENIKKMYGFDSDAIESVEIVSEQKDSAVSIK